MHIFRLAALSLVTTSLVTIGSPAEAVTPSCGGLTATIVGTSGADRITGTEGDDVIAAGRGNDTVRGLGGKDVVCGNSGNDRLLGGRGEDRLYGGDGTDRINGGWSADMINGGDDAVVTYPASGPGEVGDVLDGGPGNDNLNPGPAMGNPREMTIEPDLIIYEESPHAVTVDLSAGPATGTYTAEGNGTDTVVWREQVGIVGSAYADHLTGSSAQDFLTGGPGDDELSGGAGFDTLEPDRSEYAAGRTNGKGGGNDTVRGDADNDNVTSFAGADHIDAGGGATDSIALLGGRAHQARGEWFYVSVKASGSPLDGSVLDAGTGDGRLRVAAAPRDEPQVIDATGSTGSTTYIGIHEYVFGGRGTSWIFHGTGTAESTFVDGARLVAYGNGGDDRLAAGGRHDRLFGGAGNDVLAGWDGDDLLDGGEGTDRANGGRGTDTCRAVEQITHCEQ